MVVHIDPDKRFQLARVAYGQEDYAEAVLQCRMVAKTCRSCEVGPPGSLCRCRDYIAACDQTEWDMSRVLKKECSCPANSSAQCPNETHIDAVVFLAKILFKMQKFTKGIAYAQSALFLAPTKPECYLLLGAYFSRADKYAAALAVYREGLKHLYQLDQAYVEKLLPQFRQHMFSTEHRQKRTDPINELPPELKHNIFDQLDMKTRGNCLAVSKNWREFLSHSPHIWRHQQYTNVKRALKPQYLDKFLRDYASRMARTLEFDDCDRLGITPKRLIDTLKLCPILDRLKLNRIAHNRFREFPNGPLGPLLKTLYLGPEVYISTATLQTILTGVAGSLRELTVLKFPETSHQSAPWPRMRTLHTLKIAAPRYQSNKAPPHSVDMVSIIAQTPHVKTAWIDDMLFYSKPNTLPDADVPLWPRLERIFVGSNVYIGHTCHDHFPLFIGELPESMTDIVIERGWSRDLDHYQQFLDLFLGTSTSEAPTTIAHLPNLRKVSLKTRNTLMPSSYRELLQPSLQNGALQELELYPFPWGLMKDGGNPWFQSEKIGVLGMNGLAVDQSRAFANHEAALGGLLGRFPNLHTLDIDNEPIELPALGRLVTKGIRTIYHSQGALMTDLKNWAKGKGADVIHGKLPSTAAIRAGEFDSDDVVEEL